MVEFIEGEAQNNSEGVADRAKTLIQSAKDGFNSVLGRGSEEE